MKLEYSDESTELTNVIAEEYEKLRERILLKARESLKDRPKSLKFRRYRALTTGKNRKL